MDAFFESIGTFVQGSAFCTGLVGSIERQRHVVEVLLQQLDRPGHQFRAVDSAGPMFTSR